MSISPDHLQRLAADPQACVWVNASAGTGKTKVLTDRVLNLLLEGAAPHRILCLTFTRAAAGEMQNRLHQRLSEWVVLEPEELKGRLRTFLGCEPTNEQLLRARTLFPIVLDSPGGMKIQTIHGFCQSILRRFPLEANLTPNFQVLDESMSDHLLQRVQDEVLRSDSSLRPHLARLTDVFDDASFIEMLSFLMGERHKWLWLLQETKGVERAQQELENLLGVRLSDSAKQYIDESDRFKDVDALRQAAEHLRLGSETDQARGEVLLTLLQQPYGEAYRALFLTADGEVRKRLATKKVVDLHPEVVEVLTQEAERLQALQDKLNALNCAQRTWAIINLGLVILERYGHEKQRRGQLDYNDLIEQTAQLLGQPDVAPWVLFKLDGGLDHILVDEAQDTNLHQWIVISSLAEEFFSGSGARDGNRTLFVVGDLKQSIYSFQGANPYVFDGMRRRFTASANNWREVQLNTSFRSTQAVLAAVDKVFEQTIAREGVAVDEELIEHHSYRRGQGGLVELWPLVSPSQEPEMTPWTPPVVVESQDVATQVQLARGIAQQIKQWLENRDVLASKGRPIRASDILVLVRRRSSFVDDLVRALKQAGVPVAGADRMDLLNHLAVQDLIAVGKFVVQPLDDLNLACVLKGPLVGLSEEELFELAYDRGDQSLWERVKTHPVATYLEQICQQARNGTPFDFYAHLLGSMGARHALLSRLGAEAHDPIDEFLNVVQHYQLSHVPSLLGFLTWLSDGELEVKRDLEQGAQDEVRIMTVHGSKGLQAPIVFLPDTVHSPRHNERILWASCGEHAKLPIWAPPAARACRITEQLKGQAQQLIDQEYRRLLYVAMTRAEDRLYVCGWQSALEPKEGSWYAMIESGLKTLAQALPFEGAWEGELLRYSCPQVVELAHEVVKAVESVPSMPDWVVERPLLEQSEGRAPRPSGEVPVLSSSFERGTVIHKLLQYLPTVPVDRRDQAGYQLLRTMPHVPEDSYFDLMRDVSRVLNEPDLKVWLNTGRAEVPIAGEINGRQVSGQVDRLVVLERDVIIIDYKTNRVPPTNIQEVPLVYLHQLATYKEILQRIYPHHNIRCVLLWTQTLNVMEVPQ